MLVVNFKAQPDPRGGRIVLSWTNPGDVTFGGVRILRRETAFPGTGDPRQDFEVANLPVASQPAGALVKLVDSNLKHETVYYYAAVPYDTAGKFAPSSYASAMTTTPYRTATHLYNNLPALYRRYDTTLPPEITAIDPADRQKGQLQRFIDLFGLQFDLLRSFASGMDHFYDPQRVDGALLPLLASWIGWDTNHTLGFDKQRSELQFAPHYFRTTGIAASLRGTVNRLVSWEAHLKEFVHNVFLASAPEQLTVWEKQNKTDVWQPAKRVSLDIAYEGRPAVLQTSDRRQWLFHHARQSAPLSSNPAQKKSTLDYWHIWYKLLDREEWLPAHHVSFGGTINKYPAAIEDANRRVCVFWTSYQLTGTQTIPEIRLALLAAGQRAQVARAEGTASGPFAFVDGDVFEVRLTTAVKSFNRRVTFRREHFQNIATATIDETVALLNREIPDVLVTANDDGHVCLTTEAMGAAVRLEFPASPVATKLGLTSTVTGGDAAGARMLSGLREPFALAENDVLSIRMDDRLTRTITFTGADFINIGRASAVEVAAAIERVLPGVASALNGRVELSSTMAGAASSLVIEVVPSLLFNLPLSFQRTLDVGEFSKDLRDAFARAGFRFTSTPLTLSVQTRGVSWLINDGPKRYLIRREEEKLNVFNRGLAAPKLGFGVPLPFTPSAADCEPAVLKDAAGRIWLFWSSRRTGTWNIWFSRSDGRTWEPARPLTTGPSADREPAVLFVPADGGRVWLFWSRKKPNGLWNIFFRSTAKLGADEEPFSEVEAREFELEEVPANAAVNYDNREPSAVIQQLGNAAVELFFSSNRSSGWHIWSKVITTALQRPDVQINSGHITHRAPAVLKVNDKLKKLFFRANESEVYTSALYPAAQTIDARYSGSTTLDTRNPAKISLRKNIKDIQTYTYDTRKADDNWYARDTVGIYLVPDTKDQSLIVFRRNQMETLLRSFLPIQVRTVFIIDQVFLEFVYTYDEPTAEEPAVIREQTIDTILSEVLWGPLSKADRGPAESGSYQAGFRFLRTFDQESDGGLLPDLTEHPPKLSFRLFMRDVADGERE